MKEGNTMEKFLEKVYTATYETNEKGELKQNVRNEFKREVLEAVQELFVNAGLKVSVTKEGLAVEFANEVEGAMTVVFDGTVKSFTYDVEQEAVAYTEAQAQKAINAAKKEAEKAEKLAQKEAVESAKTKKATK